MNADELLTRLQIELIEIESQNRMMRETLHSIYEFTQRIEDLFGVVLLVRQGEDLTDYRNRVTSGEVARRDL